MSCTACEPFLPRAAKLCNVDTFVEHSTADKFAAEKVDSSAALSLGKGIYMRHELREPLEEVSDETAIVRLLLPRSAERR